MTEDYLALAKEARDALRVLLLASEPGTGLILHNAYSHLKEILSEAESTAIDEQRREEREEYRARRTAWRQTTRAERNHRILNALQDDRLILSELLERIKDNHQDCEVYEGDLRRLVKALVLHGELGRTQEPRVPGGTAWRWRYHRRVAFGSEITALERALGEAGGV